MPWGAHWQEGTSEAGAGSTFAVVNLASTLTLYTGTFTRRRTAWPPAGPSGADGRPTAVDGFVSYGSGAAQGLPANLFGGEAKLSVSLSNGQTGACSERPRSSAG